MIRRAALLLSLVALLAPAGVLAAAPRASLPDIEDEVMCPVCGVPLNIADSPQARDEKRFIAGLIARGETKPQIKDELVREYGRNVLALPKTSGFSLAAYVVPIALVVALITGLLLGLPRWRARSRVSRAAGGEAAAPSMSATDAARLDADLARYEP